MRSPLLERFLKETGVLHVIRDNCYSIIDPSGTYDSETIYKHLACIYAGEASARLWDSEAIPSRIRRELINCDVLTPEKLPLISSEFFIGEHTIATFFRWRLENGV